jgi:hypothetical protein
MSQAPRCLVRGQVVVNPEGSPHDKDVVSHGVGFASGEFLRAAIHQEGTHVHGDSAIFAWPDEEFDGKHFAEADDMGLGGLGRTSQRSYDHKQPESGAHESSLLPAPPEEQDRSVIAGKPAATYNHPAV